MAEAMKTEDCFAEPGDVECDFCTGRKRKARESCLVCLASYCKTHVKSHYQSPAFKRHKLVKASTGLQEKLCSKHDKLMEIYCRTDQTCICYLCMMDEHKTHDTADAAAERTEKQGQLKKVLRKSEQRLQEKEKKLHELKRNVNTVKRSAQSAVEDSERIFTELIRSIEKKRSEVTELIRDQEKTELSAAEELLEQLEQEITDLKRRNTELEQLSHTEDHIHFLQIFQSVCVPPGYKDTTSTTVQHLSFDEVRKSLSDLKVQFKDFCEKEFCKVKLPEIPKCKEDHEEPQLSSESERCGHSKIVVAVQMPSHPKPKTREDFLQYFFPLTLDPSTLYHKLSLSEENKMVTWRGGAQRYPDHPERFDHWPQVLCKEGMSGRCYWEVEWDNGGWGVSISVSYKDICRKGDGDKCAFGGNSKSWSLECSSIHSFWHNNIETKISAPPSSRIGVYVDHSAGTLSFYGVSDTMTLLHTVHTTFTQPLYAGFWMKRGMLKLCDPNVSD
ncbi:tripartite motif-containing protein 16 [Astyanax mexicanus]|uniref:tripartite motif-containing protein 16 n=1 Tax=Astyanax mexicanus TaxID=7994 RepID=UPI0020CB6952|nr:tripartite motif-containing protein 16 [Astyanax mexicanus]XP_015464114.3 tripartite motif-containing protein 16 [Astyanax mexicanus]